MNFIYFYSTAVSSIFYEKNIQIDNFDIFLFFFAIPRNQIKIVLTIPLSTRSRVSYTC